jgi:uncharacterized protein YdeI (YjbR/CyaY-like superfamily)
MAKSKIDEFERFYPPNRTEWRAWLADHYDKSPGVWVIRYKVASKQPTISYDELVEEALCFGWVDSLPRKLDNERHMSMVTPRKPKSGWSKVNKARIERLIAQGLMTAIGLAKIEAAKADGSWTALDSMEALHIPDDLQAALAANADAKRHFDVFPPGSQKIILQWVGSAKTAETRAKRIAESVRLAAQNIRANQNRP